MNDTRPEAAAVAPVSLAGRRIFVAGHRGMVGSALMRALAPLGATLLTVDHATLDLRRQAETEAWVAQHRPEIVFAAAAKVGGILANDSLPAQFLYDNLMIQANLVEAARRSGVARVMLFGSSCIYPRLAPQPIPEDSLLTGPLEPTNQWYAVAKIAGVKLAQAYRREHGLDVVSVMPTNLYGPGDNYSQGHSHVAAALLRRIHEAKLSGAAEVTIWGTGTPRREFLHVDDLAAACVFLMQSWSSPEPINIGSGEEVSIAELARLIAETVGWQGEFRFDTAKPDGTPRKLLDSGRLARLGWRPRTTMQAGLPDAYADFRRRWDGGEFA